MPYSTTSPEELELPDELGLPGQLDLKVLADHCAQQTERFFQKELAQDHFCFELLRRAFVLHNQAAWEYVHKQYRPLVASWVQKHPSFAACHEDVEFFVNGAFARVERWCTAERFVKFAGLPQWLLGLKACINSEIIDYLRQQVTFAQQLEWNEETVGVTTAAPHVAVVDSALRAEAWQMIQERLLNEQEFVLVEYSFVLGHKSREICALRPDLFADIQAVYGVKDNLLRRLRRDPVLRRLFENLSS